MKKIVLFFIFGALFFSVKGQENTQKYPYFEKAKHYRSIDKDSAYYYFNKAIERATQRENLADELAVYTFLIGLNAYYFDLSAYKKNLYEMAVRMKNNPRFDSLEQKDYYLHYQLFHTAGYYYKLGEFKLAKKYFFQLYAILNAVPPHKRELSELDYISSIMAYLANIYSATGKKELAIDYYRKNLDFLETHKGEMPEHEHKSSLVQLSLAAIFQKRKEYSKAEAIINKRIRLYETDEKSAINKLESAYRLLAFNYLEQNKPNKALVVLNKIAQKNLISAKNLKFLSTKIKYKARAFAQKGNFETSLRLYRKSLKIIQEYYQTNHHPDIAEIYAEMAGVFADQKEFGNSLSFFQKALMALSKGFESSEFKENPSPEQVLSKLNLIEILGKKQKILAEAYQFEKNLDYLKAANQTAKSIVRTLDALKSEFESKVDMQFLLEETYPAFHQMIEAAFLLYEKTDEQQYLKDAYYFSEKSKAVLLLSAVQKTGATKFAGIPDSVLTKEKEFHAKINHLEKKRFKNPTKKRIGDNLFETKNEFYSFLAKIEEQYPKYHRLKYKTEVASLEKIKNMLRPEEAILSYYLAQDQLYYFLIDKNEVQFNRIPFSADFSTKIREFQKLLSSPSVLKIDRLQQLSNKLREKLLPKINSSISSLIIVRSGILNYIPFEALYSSEEKEYLVEDYAVGYANSITLYWEYAQREKSKNHRLLAFAPSFENVAKKNENQIGLGTLLYNKKEVKRIGNYFGGAFLLNDDASLQAFKNKAKKFGVLHLATHAVIDDKFPDYSYLAFAPSKDNVSNLLYIKDLYNYDLDASLVTLSACETGIGKLQKGAGMLSLARGFQYAGVSSLVTTQWKINDKSASVLMENFYQKLAKGEAKNLALQHAKINYLKTTDDPMQRHPYYWAGFVLTGNTSPIVENSSFVANRLKIVEIANWYWWLAIALVLLVFVFWVFYKKRTS